MVVPEEVLVWAMLGSALRALRCADNVRGGFRAQVREWARTLVGGTLYGIALSDLALSMAPYWTVTSLLTSADRWALAFMFAATSDLFGPILIALLHALLRNKGSNT